MMFRVVNASFAVTELTLLAYPEILTRRICMHNFVRRRQNSTTWQASITRPCIEYSMG